MGAVPIFHCAASGDSEFAGVVSISAPATSRTPPARPQRTGDRARPHPSRRIAKPLLHVGIAPTWNAPAFPPELVRGIVVPVAIVHGNQ